MFKRFDYVAVCSLEGHRPMHPRGRISNPQVFWSDDRWYMVVEYGVLINGSFCSGLYQSESRNGLVWTDPVSIQSPTSNTQFHSPSACGEALAWHNGKLQVEIYLPRARRKAVILPRTKHDKSGLSDPTVLGPFDDDQILVIYEGKSYTKGMKPCVMASVVNSQTGRVTRYAEPLVTTTTDDGTSQPFCMRTEDGFHFIWVENKGSLSEVRHGFTRGNLDYLKHNLTKTPIFDNLGGWRRKIYGPTLAVGPDGKFHMWFYGQPNPDRNEYVIGYAKQED